MDKAQLSQFGWLLFEAARESLKNTDTPENDELTLKVISGIKSIDENIFDKVDALFERLEIDPTLSGTERWAAIGWALASEQPEFKPTNKVGRPSKNISIDTQRAIVLERFKDAIIREGYPLANNNNDFIEKIIEQSSLHPDGLPIIEGLFPRNMTTIETLVQSVSRGKSAAQDYEMKNKK